MKNSLLLLLVCSALLLPACHVPSASKPKVQAMPKYKFEEVKPNRASPCAVCVGFDPKTRYRRGRIAWDLCSTEHNRGYLDLKVTKGQFRHAVRLLRDCDELEIIKLMQCPFNGNDGNGLTLTLINYGENESKVSISNTEEEPNGPILEVTVPTTNQIGVKLAAGWVLDFERLPCSN